MKLTTLCAGVLVAGTQQPVRAQPAPAQPVPPASSQPPPANAITITVADAVRSALAHNPDVVKLSLDVDIADVETDRQRGQFQPMLLSTASYRHEGVYTTNVVVGNNTGVDTMRTATITGSFTGRTTFGDTYSINIGGERVGNFNLYSTLIPVYQTAISARYTHPLLRGAGTTPNRGLIDRAKLAADASRHVADNQRLALAIEVVASYWSLIVRREEVKIREASVAEAVSLRDLVERRIKGGQAPKSDLIQADVTIATREQLVRQARMMVIDGEKQLLALTYFNRSGKFEWSNTLIPTETPGDAPAKVDFNAALEIALKHRPEIRRLEQDLAFARLDRDIAANEKKMRLDLYAEAGLLGLAGTPIPGSMNPPLVIGGIGRTLKNMATAEAPFFEVGLSLELPFGNDLRAAAEKQAKLRVDKVLAEDVKSQISIDVRAAIQRLEIAASRLDEARKAQALAVANVDVQRKRYEGGAATIFDTVRVQDELTRWQGELVLAAAEQELALAQLLAAEGTLLETLKIEEPRR